MPQESSDTGEEDEGPDRSSDSTSFDAISSSNSLSETSDYEHEDRKQEMKAVNLPTDSYNKLADRTLFSLGYAGPEKWPQPETGERRLSKPNLYELLSELMRQGRRTNAVITIADSRLEVHLIVLQCFSGLFCDLNSEASSIDVELPSQWVTPRAFHLVYNWMMQDEPLLSRHGLLEVLRAASFLRVPQLQRQCEMCLTHGIQEDAAAMLYLEARLLRMERAQRPLLQRVGCFFLTLVASQEFLQLSMPAVCLLLSSNSIGVNAEMEVFMSAVRWLNYQWPKRRPLVAQLISCIRFALVPPWLLIRLQDRHSSSMQLRHITTQPEVLHQIHDSLGYTTARLRYGSDRDAFKLHVKRSGMQPPLQRNWIYDRLCSYHHRLNCQISEEFTYESFLHYLNWLQQQHKDHWRSLEPVNASGDCCLCSQLIADSKQPKGTKGV
ncbi:kelch-like protein 3 [Drosophila grimshawi]|uniref:kelch-like protein 3 n=1 Tax=Drosophila grimshawi TaxID=7222 RepID=UPI000C86E54C|nr:kelch-like protein 3 [Drosophila grimshawi]